MPMKLRRGRVGGEYSQPTGVVTQRDRAIPSTDKEWFMEMPSIVTHTLARLTHLIIIDN